MKTPRDGAANRYIGLDLGSETVKAVELIEQNGQFTWHRRACVEHHHEPATTAAALLATWDWDGITGAAVTGRNGRLLNLPKVPVKQAQLRGARHLLGPEPLTLVSIGSHGFSILEARSTGVEVLRENSRCSQGTGNFLRQLVERFGLEISEAGAMCATVQHPAVLSGRCPVILKTDMTHLANKGEDRAAILAGLFDAVCDNVLNLIKPGLSPARVVLLGGVARTPRVTTTFQSRLATLGMEWTPLDNDDGLYFEALGTALEAATPHHGPPPGLAALEVPPTPAQLERIPALAAWRSHIRRMPPPAQVILNGKLPALVIGLDIGSTGSKLVALDPAQEAAVWEAYRPTGGDPVGAAQDLLARLANSPAGRCPVTGFGTTGSGREIAGSLLTACYGKERVYILNEIAAHAAGAHHYDPRVDTIFEIGGQDAKYIRLTDGRVSDCAMNEACSAGTGSFIEEQGRKFSGIRDVVHLAEEAMRADEGVSLGQHCSVFMAEVIDEAVAAGVPRTAIIAGLYDSIIQNYLNRVKGSRSVGQVVFCQGMPFASDALAAAVARQTGAEVIVPPNPGTVGALGIALLAARELAVTETAGIDLSRFLDARVEGKDTFQCKATVGCGSGNLCRIERLRTVVAGKHLAFTWGGGCALHDKGTRTRKLPDLSPDPFRERERLIANLTEKLGAPRGRQQIALTDEFALKGLLPFFARFLHALGMDLWFCPRGGQADLKRGIRGANVAFCAPMQMYHGLAAQLADSPAPKVFLPMLRSLPAVNGESHAVACPIVQASPDLVRWDLAGLPQERVVSPVIDLHGGLESPQAMNALRELATSLGFHGDSWRHAHRTAVDEQRNFEQACANIGREALAFCETHGITPVVVLGRPYTIYNQVLNSNVPAILREQGAVGIPVDCYPLDGECPSFDAMYWGQGQRILRAAHQVRRKDGQYSLYCSNYACGPDSFNLHFYAQVMTGKPFAVIETDGHSGDAGTKTRVEAFLHCVELDRRRSEPAIEPEDLSAMRTGHIGLAGLRDGSQRLLVPWMNSLSAALAACLKGRGIDAECLPPPDRDALRRGRRHTSGKECLPMSITLGSLLQRLDAADASDQFIYLHPSTYGPCRFGVYGLLNQIVLKRLGWADRIRIWSPADTGYFDEFPAALGMLTYTGVAAADLLDEMSLTTATEGADPAAVDAIRTETAARLDALLEREAAHLPTAAGATWQLASGRLFGICPLLEEAARAFAALRDGQDRPTVLLVGEIYVRCVAFANDRVAERLGQRGIRMRLAPVQELLDYAGHCAGLLKPWWDLAGKASTAAQAGILHTLNRTVTPILGWPPRHRAPDILDAARPYMRDALEGEAVQTLGASLVAWRHHEIDGVVSAGPHECMPNKIAESQFFHLAEREGMPSLTLAFNGDPLDDEVLDRFAYEVHSRRRNRQANALPGH